MFEAKTQRPPTGPAGSKEVSLNALKRVISTADVEDQVSAEIIRKLESARVPNFTIDYVADILTSICGTAEAGTLIREIIARC